jgi:methylglyoxal synthase
MVRFQQRNITRYTLFATGDSGKKIIEKTSLEIKLLKDGGHGGDMELEP